MQATFALPGAADGLHTGHVQGWPAPVALISFDDGTPTQTFGADEEALARLGAYDGEAGERLTTLHFGGGPPALTAVRNAPNGGLPLARLAFNAGRLAAQPEGLALPDAQWPVVTGDVDDDGRNELVYACDGPAVCIDRLAGDEPVRWRAFPLEAPLRFAEVADHDQDQRSDLLVVTEDDAGDLAAGLITWTPPE